MGELIERRNLNSKHIDNENGTLTMDAHYGHIHYQDGQKFEQINTTLESIAEGWIQTKASYHLMLPKYSDGRIIFNDRFNADREIIFTPVANHIQGILLDNVDGWIQKRVRYANAFGHGIHLECTVGNVSFRKEVVIDANPGQDVEVRFKLEMPVEKLLIGGKIDTLSHQKDLTGKAITIGDSDVADELTYLRKATAWDAEGNSIDIPIRFEMRGRDLYLIKTIPALFLANAVYPVRGDTTTSYFAGVGDGGVRYNVTSGVDQAAWDSCHDATSGNLAQPTASEDISGVTLSDILGRIYIHRLFFPVDTSGLPDDATINSAFLSVYFNVIFDEYPAESQSYSAIVQTTQDSPTTLIVEDYDQCGVVNNPTKGSGNYDIGSLVVGRNSFTLNATGLGWIKKAAGDPWTMLGMREGHDIEDVKPAHPGAGLAKNSYVSCYLSERTNTGDDPYLSVTYSVPPPAITSNPGNAGLFAMMMSRGGR